MIANLWDKTNNRALFTLPSGERVTYHGYPAEGRGIKAARRDAARSWFQTYSGCDPEFFTSADGAPAPSWLRWQPSPRARLASDGYQAELRPTPSYCLEILRDYLRPLIEQARSAAPIWWASEVPVNPRSWTAEQAAIGCAPSLSAYDDPPVVVDNPYDIPYRFAGGHIHIGYRSTDQPRELGSPELAARAVRHLDKVVGVLAVAIAKDYDTPIRRQWYGRAGEFRMKPYGLEYRVLSNWWLASPIYFMLMFELARAAAVESLLDAIDEPWVGEADEVRRIINQVDIPAARQMVDANQRGYFRMLEQRRRLRAVKPFWKIWLDKPLTFMADAWQIGRGPQALEALEKRHLPLFAPA